MTTSSSQYQICMDKRYILSALCNILHSYHESFFFSIASCHKVWHLCITCSFQKSSKIDEAEINKLNNHIAVTLFNTSLMIFMIFPNHQIKFFVSRCNLFAGAIYFCPEAHTQPVITCSKLTIGLKYVQS